MLVTVWCLMEPFLKFLSYPICSSSRITILMALILKRYWFVSMMVICNKCMVTDLQTDMHSLYYSSSLSTCWFCEYLIVTCFLILYVFFLNVFYLFYYVIVFLNLSPLVFLFCFLQQGSGLYQSECAWHSEYERWCEFYYFPLNLYFNFCTIPHVQD